jgi:phosphoglycerate kinase
MNKMRDLRKAELEGKTVIVRVDLNVPLVHGKVVDTERIERVLPTLRYLVERKAKVILIAHFGRPEGKFNLDMSLAPIVDRLQEFLVEIKVKFAVDCVGIEAKKAVAELEVGEILILENLRFYKEESANDLGFARELASYGDLYVNDSFSCSHRAHSSICGITQYLPSYPGLLLEEEIAGLERYLIEPVRPMLSIIGGSKISTKLKLLKHLAEKSDMLVIGGAMANSFLKAQGMNVGRSLVEAEYIATAREILRYAKECDCEVILPQDVVVAPDLKSSADVSVSSVDAIADEHMILDIGPATVSNIGTKLSLARTVVWNGPLGAFERRPFNVGSESVARYIALLTYQGKIVSVAGGGDVVAAIGAARLKSSFSYISTAGGAFLDWLEGEDLPGLKVLKTH